MATVFSYSGTGLESAIQSGSGGIGTGASITLEVDAVPSDVSQGDTVKVALGSASDWSGGNGETAYGDIGGVGANGGTNITLTSRGQEGTTAASWSEGDPVRVGVQGRDDAGPERSLLQGQLRKPSSRVLAYDDFARPDQGLNGDTLPSGQAWTSEDTTQAEIIDGRATLTLDQSLGILRVPATSSEGVQITVSTTAQYAATDNGTGAGVVYYQDSNNWFACVLGHNGGTQTVRVFVSSGGSVSQKGGQTISSNKNDAFEHPISCFAKDDGFRTNVLVSSVGSHAAVTSGSGDIDDVMDNLTAVGLCNYATGPVRFENFFAAKTST